MYRRNRPDGPGRPTDHRTDHYALGAVFYEMLVGHPPFVSDDRLEIIHAHIARKPIPPSQLNRTMPSPLSDLVLKLLAKAPEERYQSSAALAADLKEAQKRFAHAGSIAPFPLGRRDTIPSFPISGKLYGRAEEIQQILPDVFSRVAAGDRAMLLVTGAPGIGKTTLVEAARPASHRRRRLFRVGEVRPACGQRSVFRAGGCASHAARASAVGARRRRCDVARACSERPDPCAAAGRDARWHGRSTQCRARPRQHVPCADSDD